MTPRKVAKVKIRNSKFEIQDSQSRISNQVTCDCFWSEPRGSMCYHAAALVRDRQEAPDFLATFWRLAHLYGCTQRMAYAKYQKNIPFAGISNIGNCH